MTTETALEITTRGPVAASPTAGEAVPVPPSDDAARTGSVTDPQTITVERVYHRTRDGRMVWTHGLGDDCRVERCVSTGSFAGLRRYRPEADDA